MNCTVYRVSDGLYAGERILGRGNLNPRSPGSWLIPAGCVTVPPPALAEGEQARWDGTAWVVESVPDTAAEVAPDAAAAAAEAVLPSAALVQAEARRRLAATDWYVVRQIETGEAVPAPIARFRAAIRERCNALEAANPIPPDYYADQHWPHTPGGEEEEKAPQDKPGKA
ncbi:hypothetical protein HEQ60_02350 [Haematospirillum sp. H1815]|uniref:hypothetical protein n=1 Tax=Haematospirillum sp. H1815 TaxID=2723108 RepID=UPI00143B4F44|nr:hypothetical protein [Haematospirillum sp. H1815]NKD76613.1 hypothetical protein [Haematospirillum sp. H1815]